MSFIKLSKLQKTVFWYFIRNIFLSVIFIIPSNVMNTCSLKKLPKLGEIKT
jgi:hypothetical protein